jgi:UDP-N-acetylmuramyl pentapeptide synthase
MRSELLEVNGRTVLADYYNANPASVASALEALASIRQGHRAVAVLGDMLELGDRAGALHGDIGRTAARLGIDLIICVGPLAKYIAEGALAAGMERSRVFAADTTAKGAAILKERWLPGDRVLIKGSRGMKMETIVKEF